MKKTILGSMLMGVLTANIYAEEKEKFFDPRGSVEIGSEMEEFNNSDGDFLLPYVRTKTYLNQTSPYYVEFNYTYRYHDTSTKRETDRRRRYELFIGGYEYNKGNFTWKPKIGFRHEDYNASTGGNKDRTRTYWRIYPGTTYQLTDRAQLFVGGWIAPVSDDRPEGSEETTYKHELEFGIKYKLNDKQTLNTNLYSNVELYDLDDEYSKKTTEWQLRVRLDHKFENGKTTGYLFTRIGLMREDDYKAGASDSNKYKENQNRRRNRYGIGGTHKLLDDLTFVTEVYYENARGGSNYDGNKATSRKRDVDKLFVKVGLKYTY